MVEEQIIKLFCTDRNVFTKYYKYVNINYIKINYSNIYRVFCCFDKGNLVVLFNGFQKKTQKTPQQEIETAGKLKNDYFKLKIKENEKGSGNKKR